MKKLLIVLSAVTLFASCKKEDTITSLVTPTPGATKNLTKVVYSNGVDAPETENYKYDSQGRISESKEENRTTTFDYVSPSLLIATEKKNTDNSLLGTKECTLNANGAITKMTFKNPAGAVTFTFDYTYNTDGYITNEKGTYPNGNTYETVYVIAGGNTVSSKLYYDNVLNSTREYIYDNTKLNKTAFSNSSYWYSYNLFGKPSKNLPVEFKIFDTSSTLTWHTQTTYDMGADGYPLKEITNNILQGKQFVSTYTFQ